MDAAVARSALPVWALPGLPGGPQPAALPEQPQVAVGGVRTKSARAAALGKREVSERLEMDGPARKLRWAPELGLRAWRPERAQAAHSRSKEPVRKMASELE
jgi:hypothetical protein